ncbi:MAG: hypothetical protein ACJ761_04255 [Chloroflexota bacterium]
MTGPASRDAREVEALIVDRYLESLLTARATGAGDVPSSDQVDPALRTIILRLTGDLPRFHPSFRFEERLAARLAEVAAAMRLPAAAGSDGRVISFAPVRRLDPAPGFDPLDARPLDETGPGDLRPLLIRGALTSAALSLAGAAYVAWRRSHPNAGPMARAVRAVARARLS